MSTGNNIRILSDGSFDVGEIYWKDGKRCRRVTEYYADGSELKFDY